MNLCIAVLMKFIGTKICPVLIALSAYNAYKLEMEHRSHPRPEYVPYAHLLVHRTVRFAICVFDINCGHGFVLGYFDFV